VATDNSINNNNNASDKSPEVREKDTKDTSKDDTKIHVEQSINSQVDEPVEKISGEYGQKNFIFFKVSVQLFIFAIYNVAQ
jgi:hypothetical protein